jgi:hypothetical protein
MEVRRVADDELKELLISYRPMLKLDRTTLLLNHEISNVNIEDYEDWRVVA